MIRHNNKIIYFGKQTFALTSNNRYIISARLRIIEIEHTGRAAAMDWRVVIHVHPELDIESDYTLRRDAIPPHY